MPTKGVWWSQDPRTMEWGQYAPDDNQKIEASYLGSKAPVKLDFVGNVFTVDVKKMVQTNSTGGSRKVKREEVTVAPSKPEKPAAAGGATVEYVKKTFMGGKDSCNVSDFGPLFEALGLDGATAEPFVFFHHIQAAGPWAVTAEELAAGLAGAGAAKASQSDVKKLVAKWVKEDTTSLPSFEKMWKYSFEFCRNSASASTIPGEEAVGYMTALLAVCPKKKNSHEKLCEFLGNAPNISRDLWAQLPKFLADVKEDYSNYDDFFFPSKLDDFVEAMQK